MTIEEFDEHNWFNGTTCNYRGERRTIVSVNFKEKLIGLASTNDENVIEMVRCKNVSNVESPEDE